VFSLCEIKYGEKGNITAAESNIILVATLLYLKRNQRGSVELI
jgi:hypothetical protein